MLISHGLFRLKLAPTNECNDLGHPKGVQLRVGGGMECLLCVAQVDIWRESWCVLVMLINEWVTI